MQAIHTISKPARHRVVVVGGGFAGLQAVRKLARAPVDVTLIDRKNFHLFQTLAYQVATGALSPAEIASPTNDLRRRWRSGGGCCLRSRLPRPSMSSPVERDG